LALYLNFLIFDGPLRGPLKSNVGTLYFRDKVDNILVRSGDTAKLRFGFYAENWV